MRLNTVSTKHAESAPTQAGVQALLSLARARVLRRLERATDFPVAIVCAPAGFGKSTVLRECLAARNRPYRSLELASNENDLLAFMRAFAAAAGEVAPTLRTSFMALYDRMQRGGETPKEIAKWIAGHLECAELTLLIDGIKASTDERVIALLSELVDRTAHTAIHWIFSTQTAIGFPMTRWLASGRMDVPVDDVDLALTEDDLCAAFERAAVRIPRHVVTAARQAAGDLPASIALTLNDLSEYTWRTRVHVHPYAYLAKRAFEVRTPTERRFLLEMCHYEYFDAILLEAAGWSRATALLDELCSAGAFLYVDGAQTYRFHEKFRLFLVAHLGAQPDGLDARIRRASAVACGSVGRWADALELYTGLRAAAPLAALLSEHGFDFMDRGEATVVQRGLIALDESDFATYPVALAVKASLESLHGSFDLAEAWFRQAIKYAQTPSQRGSIVFRFATDLVRQDRSDAIDVLAPIVAEGGHECALAVSLAGLLATAYATHQQTAQAALTIEGALAQMVEVDNPALRARLFFQAGYVAFFARDFQRSKEYALAAVETALASQLYDVAARALSILYNIAMDDEDDVGSARRYLDELASCSLKVGSRPLLIYATLAQFEIEVLCGNLPKTARLDEALRSLDVDYSVFASETLLPAQALRAAWNGDFHRAYRLIATTAEHQITPLRQSQRYAEIALYAAAAGLRSEAAAAIRRALVRISVGDGADKSTIFIKAYSALALSMLGRHRRAERILSTLRRSTALTSRLQLVIDAVRTINERWALGRYATGLLMTLDRLDACDLGGIRRLIEALPLPQTFRAQFDALDALERQALMALSAGRKNDELGRLLGVTADESDAVIQSMCRKLGCTSPRHAVALARSVDMLPAVVPHD